MAISRMAAARADWWTLARTLDRRVQRLLASLEPLAGDEQLPVLAEVLHTLDDQRSLLSCGIDAIRLQEGDDRQTAPMPSCRHRG